MYSPFNGNNFAFSQSYNPFFFNPYSMPKISQIPFINPFINNFNPFTNYQAPFINNFYTNPIPSNFYNQQNFGNLRTNDFGPSFDNAGFRNLQNVFARKWKIKSKYKINDLLLNNYYNLTIIYLNINIFFYKY